MALTKDQASALAAIIVPALKQHASTVVSGLTADEKKEMHPQAFAALETLSGITGTFCEVEPKIDHAINSLGWLAKKFLGSAYALLLTFQTVIKEIAATLCPAKPVETGGKKG